VALKEVAHNFKTPLKPTQKTSKEEIDAMLALVPTEELYMWKVLSPSSMEKLRGTDLTFLTEAIQGMEEKLEEMTIKTIILNLSTEQVAK
jgi:hypothetical protein